MTRLSGVTAPLPPTGLLRAVRALTLVLIGALALLCGAAPLRAAELRPFVPAQVAAADERGDTVPISIVDRAVVDADDLFDDAGVANGWVSGSTAGAVGVVCARAVQRPDGVGSRRPERPPRG